MDALLPFTPELLHEPLIVLRDSLEFSGGFMVPLLLKLALQAGQPAVLVTVAQGASHYQQALRKLGVNMAAHVQSGRLAVIDGLSGSALLDVSDDAPVWAPVEQHLVDAIDAAQQLPDSVQTPAAARAQPAAAAPYQQHPGATPAARSSSGNVANGEAAGARQRTVAVIVDDVSTLGSLVGGAWPDYLGRLQDLRLLPSGGSRCGHSDVGSTPSHGHRFGHNSATGDKGNNWDCPTSLTVLLHSDVHDATTQRLVTDAASVVIDIEPLTAGQSVDVSARMSMQLNDCSKHVPWGRFEGDPQRQFCVQVSDRGVRFLQQYTAA